MNDLSFHVFVRGLPAPQGSKRAYVVRGRPVVVEDSKHSRPWRQMVREATAAEFQKMSGAPLSGPVSLSLTFTLLRPPSVRRAWPAVRPDLDKLIRAVLDALQGAAVIYQDSQVVEVTAVKRYGDLPGVEIGVVPLEATLWKASSPST